MNSLKRLRTTSRSAVESMIAEISAQVKGELADPTESGESEFERVHLCIEQYIDDNVPQLFDFGDFREEDFDWFWNIYEDDPKTLGLNLPESMTHTLDGRIAAGKIIREALKNLLYESGNISMSGPYHASIILRLSHDGVEISVVELPVPGPRRPEKFSRS